jgi:hypothetical protein
MLFLLTAHLTKTDSRKQRFFCTCCRLITSPHFRRPRRYIVESQPLPLRLSSFQAETQAIEIEIYHRRRIEREHLAEDQPADNGYTEGSSELRPDTESNGKG